mmetsp:Transcript_1402/g.4237  ORF Transcript_1402/g.4237 Transcript_1402/m.4237 type:complete len:203 (+) Transcript_1402:111-719(+)
MRRNMQPLSGRCLRMPRTRRRRRRRMQRSLRPLPHLQPSLMLPRQRLRRPKILAKTMEVRTPCPRPRRSPSSSTASPLSRPRSPSAPLCAFAPWASIQQIAQEAPKEASGTSPALPASCRRRRPPCVRSVPALALSNSRVPNCRRQCPGRRGCLRRAWSGAQASRCGIRSGSVAEPLCRRKRRQYLASCAALEVEVKWSRPF